MKHKHFWVAGVLLCFGLSVGLSGCGLLFKTKVKDDAWRAAFDNSVNYTIDSEGEIIASGSVGSNKMTMNMKITSDMLLAEGLNELTGGSESFKVFYHKTNDEFYFYIGEKWEKNKDTWINSMASNAVVPLGKAGEGALTVIMENFDQFTLTGGKYFCESIKEDKVTSGVRDSIALKDIFVTFDGSSLKEITYDATIITSDAMGYEVGYIQTSHVKITEIGTTVIEDPTASMDKTSSDSWPVSPAM